VTIDKNDHGWKDAIKDAHEAKLSHAQFKHCLGREVKRVLAAHAAQQKAAPAKPAVTTPAAKPEPRKAIPGYDKMSFSQRLVAAGHL
jgi:hypothetical protein